MLFYAAYLAVEPVTRLPFQVCSVVKWRRAYHLTYNPTLLKIPLGLRDLLRVFLGRRAYILSQNLEYNYIINLEEGKMPPNLSIYNLSYKELKILQEYLNGLLKKGYIRPSKSPAGVLILFILKLDRTIRLYVDYRGLNKITIKNRYLLPLVSKILDRLSRAKIFTKLDLQDAYYRLRIKEGNKQKIAFKT